MSWHAVRRAYRFGTMFTCFACAVAWTGPMLHAATSGFSDACCDGTTAPCETDDWLNCDDVDCSWIDVRAGALALHRSSNQQYTMLTEQSTGQTLISTSDVNPGWTAGVELDVIVRLTSDWDFEFDWFSLGNWSRQHQPDVAGVVVNEFPTPLSTALVYSSSKFHNLELNLRYRLTDRLTLLGGFRYIELDDYFGLHYAEGGVNGVSQDASVAAQNRLYGFQLGAQAALWQAGPWELDGWVKAGIFGNAARNSVDVTFTGAPIVLPSLRAQESAGAFVGDMGLRISRRFGQHVQVFAGYRVMLVDGVALATNQIDSVTAFFSTGTPQMVTNGSPFYHGAELGLIVSF